MKDKRPFVSAAAAIVAFLLLSAGLALTKLPYSDEAFLASPALNLITRGHMGTTVVDESSAWRPGMSLKGINRRTYQVMPLHFLTQAAWYKLFGFGLFQMRSLSIAWGIALIAAWYLILKTLFDNRALAAWLVVLLATDGLILAAASSGRADMASAALGFGALAAYLHTRASSLARAVLFSHALAAAALFTHPTALLAALSLCAITLYYDRLRLRPRHVFIAAAPYLIAAAAWGLYILQDPATFREQFGSNAQGRIQGLSPWGMVAAELAHRYLPSFGLGPGANLFARSKAVILLAYGIALAGTLAVAGLRRLPGCRALLMIVAIQVGGMTLLEGTRQEFYLVHTVPALTAVLVVWLGWCWSASRVPRWLTAMAFCTLVLIQIARTVHVARLDSYHRSYLPAARYLERDAQAGRLIMGDAIFTFHLGFRDNLVDDLRLGYRTGKAPDVIVINNRYQEWFDIMRVREPEVLRFTEALLEKNYSLTYDAESFRIYRRR